MFLFQQEKMLKNGKRAINQVKISGYESSICSITFSREYTAKGVFMTA